MKKFSGFIICLLMAFNIYSQGKQSGDESGVIIRYANSVISLTNRYYQKVNAYQKKLVQLEKERDNAEFDKETPITYECPDGKTQTSLLFREATNPPAGFAKEDQTFFKTQIEAYRKKLNRLDDFCYAINDDIDGCDFKKDEFVKFDSLLRDTNLQLDQLVELHQEIVKHIMDKSTEAEKVIDSKSPLGPLVTPMKNDLRLCKSILDKVLNYTPEAITGVKIEVLRLRGGIAKNEALKILHKNEFDKKYINQFDDFYKSLKNGFAATANEVSNRLEKAGESGNYKEFANHQQALLEDYNELIKSFNSIGQKK